MILKQYYLGCLAQASYLIADEETKRAAVVDPRRDIGEYLEEARSHGLRIEWALLTHFHADFVSGHLELRERCGARIGLGAGARAEYGFEPLRDGDLIDLGSVRIQVLETPGHTPESVCYLVFDLRKDEAHPAAVLTGDTLFIGDVGRPDLMASAGVTAAELAGRLFDSLHAKLLPLPDGTLVYPGHGAGSMCGKNLSTDTFSTMGQQRRYNYALQPMTREEFVAAVTAEQPEAPAYFSFDAEMNRRERPTLDRALASGVRPLSLEELLRLQAEGATVLDVRDPADFEGAHVRGSVNIGLGGKYATWAGTLLDRSRPIVVVAEPGREEEAAVRLGRIGFDIVAGFLSGGMGALTARPDLVDRTGRITAQALAESLAEADPPLVLDVRTESEWRESRIEGSLNVPLPKLESRAAEIPGDRPIAIHCLSGYRSSIAASLLKRRGVTDLLDLVGGIAAWKAAHLPTARDEPAD